jgi:hypothetical protein
MGGPEEVLGGLERSSAGLRRLQLRERAVRLYFESDRPIAHIAHDLGIPNPALGSSPKHPDRLLERELPRPS